MEKLLTFHQTAKLLNVWPHTLRRWEKAGKFIEYKDRLARFGYKYLEQYFRSFGIKIDIIESNEEKSPQEELVADMIAIVTSFSARIYGKCGGHVAKKLTELIEQEVAAGENHG